MNTFFFKSCVAFLLFATTAAFAISDKDARVAAKEREATEIQMWTKSLETADTLPFADKIDLLGRGLRNMAHRKKWPASDERIAPLYDDLQAQLLAISGHAEFFESKINDARQRMEDARGGDLGTFAYLRGKLYDVVRYDFPVFEELPSHETVRVMGEFLSDERGYYKMNDPMTETDIQRQDGEAPVFARAAMTLTKLPIENKPVPDLQYPFYTNPEDVKPWRDWIEEIKSGKRTFRFKGDPTDYDLNGPASKEKVERIAKNRERDEGRRAGNRNTTIRAITAATEPEEPHGRWISTIAACVASLVIAGWFFMSKRKKNS